MAIKIIAINLFQALLGLFSFSKLPCFLFVRKTFFSCFCLRFGFGRGGADPAAELHPHLLRRPRLGRPAGVRDAQGQRPRRLDCAGRSEDAEHRSHGVGGHAVHPVLRGVGGVLVFLLCVVNQHTVVDARHRRAHRVNLAAPSGSSRIGKAQDAGNQ